MSLLLEVQEGSTEMQEDTELEGTAYAVQPIEVKVTRYIPVGVSVAL